MRGGSRVISQKGLSAVGARPDRSVNLHRRTSRPTSQRSSLVPLVTETARAKSGRGVLQWRFSRYGRTLRLSVGEWSRPLQTQSRPRVAGCGGQWPTIRNGKDGKLHNNSPRRLVVKIAGFQPADPGSTPGGGTSFMRGGAAVAQRAHNPQVAGSNPAPATSWLRLPGEDLYTPSGASLTDRTRLAYGQSERSSKAGRLETSTQPSPCPHGQGSRQTHVSIVWPQQSEGSAPVDIPALAAGSRKTGAGDQRPACRQKFPRERREGRASCQDAHRPGPVTSTGPAGRTAAFYSVGPTLALRCVELTCRALSVSKRSGRLVRSGPFL